MRSWISKLLRCSHVGMHVGDAGSVIMRMRDAMRRVSDVDMDVEWVHEWVLWRVGCERMW